MKQPKEKEKRNHCQAAAVTLERKMRQGARTREEEEEAAAAATEKSGELKSQITLLLFVDGLHCWALKDRLRERERERVEKVQSKSVTLRGGQSAPYAGKREREDPKEGDPNKAQSITKTHTQTTADNSRQTGQMTVEHKLQHCHHHHRHRNLVNLSLPLLL